ncbi:MAG: hypothetical protein HS129_05025 [Leptospiraceae bacterium]|nr:hypothetical protein [Leptospiraceae bacterium]
MSLFPGLERAFTIVVDGLRFSGEFPRPSDKMNISVNISRRLEGLPVASIQGSMYGYANLVETLNYVMTERPEQFRGVNFWNIEDEEFVARIYFEFEKKYATYKESLKKNNDRGRDRQAPPESKPSNEPVPHARVQDIAERIQ